MKITFVTATLTSGGSERVISLLANELVHRGHDVSVVLLRKPIVFYPIDPSVKLCFALEQCGNELLKGIWLRKLVKKEKPDVVIPFMTAVYCFTIFWLMGTNIPIISSERIDPRHSSFVRKVLRKLLLKFTTHLVAQTKEIKNYYSKTIQEKCSIIPNPVSDKVFEITHNENKESRIISVGRLFRQKNQHLMIEAFSKIAEKYPNYNLVIFGEGPLRNELEEHISIKGMQRRILLPGRNNNIIEELNKSEIFCLSSDYEGMSNALIEAVCVGLPIITTRVSGVDELIKEEKNGIILQANEPTALSEAMARLIENTDLRERFSNESRRMASQFKLSHIVEVWEKLIYKVISNEQNA